MAQPFLQIPDVYRVRIQKHGAEDVTDVWLNEYDVKYPTGVVPTPTDTVLAALLAYEQVLHYNTVIFDNIFVNAYTVGRGPSAPFSLDVPVLGGTTGNQPAALTSLAGQGGNPIGGEVCLGVKKTITNQRRGGRNFYRGCLKANDVIGETGGEWIIHNNPQFPTQYTLLALPHMQPFLVGGGDPHQLLVVHSHRDPAPPHNILTLGTSQVSMVDLVTPQVFNNKISHKSKR